MIGNVQRAAKKVREARKLLASAHDQAPELDLAPLVTEARGAEDRAAALLRQGFNRGKDEDANP